MSRLEKHKERREGEITINRDKVNEDFAVNPLEESKETIKKTAMNASAKLAPAIKPISSENKKELFDIEDAFNNLKRYNLSPDHDTQLEIIKEILSGQVSEYNDVDFEVDKKTKKIKISEFDLTKLLEEREKKQAKKVKKSKKIEAKAIKKEVKTRKDKKEGNLLKPKKKVKGDKDKVVYKDLSNKKPKLIWVYYLVIVVLFLLFFALLLIFFL